MKLVLVSNYLNAHMIPLCEAFCRHPQIVEFVFVATTPFGNERKKMGFSDESAGYSYVFSAYLDAAHYEESLRLTAQADVAIVADAPNDFVDVRMKQNKLTFLCSERFYKLGIWRRFIPFSYLKKRKRFLQYKKKQLYYLAIGAYTAYDLELIGFPIEKCYQWAYFPAVQAMDESEIDRKNEEKTLRIFWAGRFLKVKHPNNAVRIAEKLKQKQVDFHLCMAGDGPEYKRVQQMIKDRQLENYVDLLGNLKPAEVQAYMQNSSVFLFTSDYWEGWGAVLSEAMAAGCVPVASIGAGASHILIRQGENGILYRTNDEATDGICHLANNPGQRKRMAHAAYHTLHEEWRAEKAAQRFISVADALLNGENLVINDGPMKRPDKMKAKNYFI